MKNNVAAKFGLELINGAKSFPAEAGRYSVTFLIAGIPDTSGLVDSFESACREARLLLDERADYVTIMDHKRGYVVAVGKV